MYVFVLREGKVTIFELKLSQNVLQHFATKLGNSTNFRMVVLTVVKDFVRRAYIES